MKIKCFEEITIKNKPDKKVAFYEVKSLYIVSRGENGVEAKWIEEKCDTYDEAFKTALSILEKSLNGVQIHTISRREIDGELIIEQIETINK